METTALQQHDNERFEQYCDSLRSTRPWNKRLLLIQIPQVILDAFNRDIALDQGYYNYPPTGLQYLYESIKHRDFDVQILDLNFELLKRIHDDPDFSHEDWPEILEQRLESFQPDIVGVSCLFDQGIKTMLTTLRLVRQRGHAITIGGGVIATYESETLVDRNLCHFVVKGEGENKINYLLDHLTDENLDCPPTPGIYFQFNGATHETSGPPDIVEPNGDMIDSYDLVPIGEYYRYGSLNPYSRRGIEARVPFAAIQINRGCRAECTFCAVRDFMGKGVRCRPLDDVIKEMTFLVENHGVGHFEFLDDDPTFNRREFKLWLQTVIDKKWNIKWSANNGIIAASLDQEAIQLMNDSGCIGFKVGIETGNPALLRKVKKPARHDKFLSFSKAMRPYPQMFVGGNFIVGLPEENFAMMMDSFKFMLEVNLDWAAITVCQIIRGASAFADSGEYFEEQMESDGETVSNFIPTRKTSQGHVETDNFVLRGLDIFEIDPETTPSAGQVKEIWFTFNILANYIYNPNLRRDGTPEKFITWVENVRRAWPTNAYMSLFLSLAKVLVGDAEEAHNLRESALRSITDEYWRERFSCFHLDSIIEDNPQTPDAVYRSLENIRGIIDPAFNEWMTVEYGAIPQNLLNPIRA